MAVTSTLFYKSQLGLSGGDIDFVDGDIRVALCTQAYAPDFFQHQFFADVTNEVVGTGYTAGGQALTGKTATYDPATRTVKLDCADPVWENSSISARWAVFYAVGATPASSPLLCFWDLGETVTSEVGPFSLFINPAGLVTLTAA